MHFVGFGEVGFLPFGHGAEAAHNAELVPNASLVLFGQGEECLAGDIAVRVLHETFLLDLAIHVVVGLENNRHIRVHFLDAGNELVVVVFKLLVVKLFHVCIVNADGENDEVGLVE